jgi:ABC-type proline/glycine betaine transport system permease subunit
LLLGYFAGVIIGVPLGLLTARFPLAERHVGRGRTRLADAAECLLGAARACFGFGQTEAAMQFVVIMGTLWSVQISTDSGVRNVPPLYRRAAQTMGSRGMHTWIKVILPASLPFIISGVKQGWAFAWRSLMAAEIYVTILTGSGLGMLLHYGRENLDMAQVIGVMLVIVLSACSRTKSSSLRGNDSSIGAGEQRSSSHAARLVVCRWLLLSSTAGAWRGKGAAIDARLHRLLRAHRAVQTGTLRAGYATGARLPSDPLGFGR